LNLITIMRMMGMLRSMSTSIVPCVARKKRERITYPNGIQVIIKQKKRNFLAKNVGQNLKRPKMEKLNLLGHRYIDGKMAHKRLKWLKEK